MMETVSMTRAELARIIDHTLLEPEATAADIVRHCREAGLLGVGAVCISPSRLPLAPGVLAPGIAVDAVAGFPSGAHLAAVKAAEAAAAVAAGASEVDMMIDLLMAIVWRSMTAAELTTWTAAMIASGQRADLSGLGRPTVDKHSTGGVGDKLSLIVVPLVAVFGAAVPQMSGRGLGHTGGTLDKLEAIPGWRADLDPAELFRLLDQVGGVITAAGPELDPADRRLYALRDITATVESIPLIASSIMSKKVAEGTRSLLLDVKVGAGAFMTDLGQARLLAQTMTQLGQTHGVRTAAVLTPMDTPLGRAVGNAVEVQEALDVLGGGGPDDVRDLAIAEAEAMLGLASVDGDPAKALADGRALDKFHEMIRAQGGDLSQPLA